MRAGFLKMYFIGSMREINHVTKHIMYCYNLCEAYARAQHVFSMAMLLI